MTFSLANHTFIVIPSRTELLNSESLWWNPIELKIIKTEAFTEMRKFIYQNKCNIKQGKQSLYQLDEVIITNGHNNDRIQLLNSYSENQSCKCIAPKPQRPGKLCVY